MEVNILITSVSRKVWLVKAFKDALKQQGIEGGGGGGGGGGLYRWILTLYLPVFM